jgi:hypothetical protein
MAVYSHTYSVERGGTVYKGELAMKENQTFSIVYKTNLDALDSTQQTALETFLTAVNTLNTALGNVDDIHITLNATDNKGKVDLTF